MSSENYVFACDGKTFNLIRSKVNTPTGQPIIDFIYNPQLQFTIWSHSHLFCLLKDLNSQIDSYFNSKAQ